MGCHPGGLVEQIAVTGIAYHNINASGADAAVGADREEATMNENNMKRVPRMRTIHGAVSEIKAMDPGSEVSEYFVRRLVKDGTLQPVWAGSKALIDLNDVLDLLCVGTTRTKESPPTVEGIRQVDVHMRPGTKEAAPVLAH